MTDVFSADVLSADELPQEASPRVSSRAIAAASHFIRFIFSAPLCSILVRKLQVQVEHIREKFLIE
ncbi:MAG: hypothetical protein LUF81_02900, partial [Clostridiales bacterium]|nr:hypothetical protein [Clostridiales bacterium]